MYKYDDVQQTSSNAKAAHSAHFLLRHCQTCFLRAQFIIVIIQFVCMNTYIRILCTGCFSEGTIPLHIRGRDQWKHMGVALPCHATQIALRFHHNMSETTNKEMKRSIGLVANGS